MASILVRVDSGAVPDAIGLRPIAKSSLIKSSWAPDCKNMMSR